MAATITFRDATWGFLNNSEISLDLSYNQFSPNPSFVSPFVIQFRCSPSQNPIKEIVDHIQTNSIAENIVATLNVDDNTKVAGQLVLGSEQSIYKLDQGGEDQIDLLFEPYVNTFQEKARKLSFNAFYGQSDWVKTRYVTERNTPIEDILFLVIVYNTTVQSAQVVYNQLDAIKETISSGFDTLSAAIKSVLKIAMNVAYIAAVLAATNELLKQASEILFDKPKALYCLSAWDVINKGCEHLGYNFTSSLQSELAGLYYLPATTTPGKVTGTPLNNPNLTISLLDFIERIGALFNGKLKVLQDEIILEQVRYYEDNPNENVKLSDLYNNGFPSSNFTELPKAISIQYAKVEGDNNYKDNVYQESYSLVSNNNKLFGANEGINVNHSFAVGQGKEEQSSVEKIFNSIFDIIAGLSKNYKISGGDRIGYLKLQQDIVQVDTIFIGSREQIAKDSYDKLKAKTLFDNYYKSESPIENQFTIITGRDSDRICGVNTNELITNNVVLDSKGRPIIVNKNIQDIRTTTPIYDVEYRRRLQEGELLHVPAEKIQTKILSVNN
jgi:hypothetical protein